MPTTGERSVGQRASTASSIRVSVRFVPHINWRTPECRSRTWRCTPTTVRWRRSLARCEKLFGLLLATTGACVIRTSTCRRPTKFTFLPLVPQQKEEESWTCSFTFGGVFAHIVTFNAHRRLMALDALRQLGVQTEGFGDPMEYEESVAPGTSRYLSKRHERTPPLIPKSRR